MRKIVYAMLVLGLLLPWLDVRQAHACSCALPPEPAVALAKANAVFSGKVLQVEEGSPFRLMRSSADPVRVVFEVTGNWKGAENSQMAVYTAMSSSSCGAEFAKGQSYLVYAYENEERRLATGLCTRTKELSLASDDLQKLGQSSAPAHRVNLAGYRGTWGYFAISAVLLLGLFGIGVLIKLKWGASK